jgi:general secretion pathway protein G
MKTQFSKLTLARSQAGMTLLELIITCAILMILAGAALPIARHQIKYQQEAELRRALREMKDAIDRYKDAADKNLIRVEVGNENYPPNLETLVSGVNVGAGSDKKVRFLRAIPKDPITGQPDWQKRCVTDDADSSSWCGKNVFDVYSNSHATGSDGRPYSEW